MVGLSPDAADAASEVFASLWAWLENHRFFS